MSDTFDIHPADEDERLEAYHDVHEVWGGELSQQEFVARRLASVQHNRATWWVLKVEGVVAASLGCYPLDFSNRRRRHPGFGLGAVYTKPSMRRRGYARALCREVIEDCRRRGRTLGLLFSDIKPRYYERLGFTRFPSYEYVSEVDNPAQAQQSWEALDDPQGSLEALRACYDRHHMRCPLYLRRDLAYWDYILSARQDPFLAIQEGETMSAYLRYRLEDEGAVLRVTEWAAPERDEALGQALLCAANQLGASKIRAWYAIAGLPSLMETRQEVITMMGSFDALQPINGPDILEGSRIWKIDAY